MHSDAGIQIKAGLTGKLIRAVASHFNNLKSSITSVSKKQQAVLNVSSIPFLL